MSQEELQKLPKRKIEIIVAVSDDNHMAETVIRGVLRSEQDLDLLADELAARCKDIAPLAQIRWVSAEPGHLFHCGHLHWGDDE